MSVVRTHPPPHQILDPFSFDAEEDRIQNVQSRKKKRKSSEGEVEGDVDVVEDNEEDILRRRRKGSVLGYGDGSLDEGVEKQAGDDEERRKRRGGILGTKKVTLRRPRSNSGDEVKKKKGSEELTRKEDVTVSRTLPPMQPPSSSLSSFPHAKAPPITTTRKKPPLPPATKPKPSLPTPPPVQKPLLATKPISPLPATKKPQPKPSRLPLTTRRKPDTRRPALTTSRRHALSTTSPRQPPHSHIRPLTTTLSPRTRPTSTTTTTTTKTSRAILDEIQYALDGIYPPGTGNTLGKPSIILSSLVTLVENIGREGSVGKKVVEGIVGKVLNDVRLYKVDGDVGVMMGVLGVVCVRGSGGKGFGREGLGGLLGLIGNVSGGKGTGRKRGFGGGGRKSAGGGVVKEVVGRVLDWDWGENGEGLVGARVGVEVLGLLVEGFEGKGARERIGCDGVLLGGLVGFFDGFGGKAVEEWKTGGSKDGGMGLFMELVGGIAQVLEFVVIHEVGRNALVRDGRIFRGIHLLLNAFLDSLDSCKSMKSSTTKPENETEEDSASVLPLGEGTICSILKLCINTIHRKRANKHSHSVNNANPCITKLHETGSLTTIHKILTHPSSEACFDLRILSLALLTGCLEDTKSPRVQTLFTSCTHFPPILNLLELTSPGMDQGVFRGYLCLLVGSLCRYSTMCRTMVRGKLGDGGLGIVKEIVKDFWVFHRELGVLDDAEDTFERIVGALGEIEGGGIVEVVEKKVEVVVIDD